MMTAESDLSLTANRVWRRTWERFYPEKIIDVIEEPIVQEFAALKSYWGPYLCARNNADIELGSQTKGLCSNL